MNVSTMNHLTSINYKLQSSARISPSQNWRLLTSFLRNEDTSGVMHPSLLAGSGLSNITLCDLCPANSSNWEARRDWSDTEVFTYNKQVKTNDKINKFVKWENGLNEEMGHIEKNFTITCQYTYYFTYYSFVLKKALKKSTIPNIKALNPNTKTLNLNCKIKH